MAQLMKIVHGTSGITTKCTDFISKKPHTINVEKAGGVIWQRHLYKAMTYKEERKTFSEMVRKHRIR